MLLQIQPVSSTNKTDRHDITEILLKVALNTLQTWALNKKIEKWGGFTAAPSAPT